MNIRRVQSMLAEKRIDLSEELQHLAPGDHGRASSGVAAQVASAEEREAVPRYEKVCAIGGTQAACSGEREPADEQVEGLRGPKKRRLPRDLPLQPRLHRRAAGRH